MKTDIDRIVWYTRKVRNVVMIRHKRRKDYRRMARLAAYKQALNGRLERTKDVI